MPTIEPGCRHARPGGAGLSRKARVAEALYVLHAVGACS